MSRGVLFTMKVVVRREATLGNTKEIHRTLKYQNKIKQKGRELCIINEEIVNSTFI